MVREGLGHWKQSCSRKFCVTESGSGVLRWASSIMFYSQGNEIGLSKGKVT